jgi:hypothetical protein
MDFRLQKQLAEQLRQKSAAQSQFQSPQGQMVSGHYVAPNPLEYLAAGLRSAGGMKGEALAAKELADIGQREKDMIMSETKALSQALRGTPGQMMQPTTPNDDEGNINPQVQMPGTPGSYDAFLSRAVESPLPQFQQLGMQGLAAMPEREARAAEKEAEREFRTKQFQDQHAMRMEALQAQNATRQQMAEEQRNFQMEMQKMRSSMAGSAAQPYFQPVQTASGVMAFNARTGRVEPVMGPQGQPIIGAAADPALQGQLAGAKTAATTEAKTEVERRLEAPEVVQQGLQTIQLVDDLVQSPGFKQAVGASRLLGVQNIPGTSAKDFDVRLEQLKGQQFLQAFETLKGGGQITEVEGKKATDAISRMNASSSEPEFKKAAREFQDVIRIGVERAQGRITNSETKPKPQARMKFDAQGNQIQ